MKSQIKILDDKSAKEPTPDSTKKVSQLLMQSAIESPRKETFVKAFIATMSVLNALEKRRFFYYMDAPEKLTKASSNPFSSVLNSDSFEKLSANYFRLKSGTSASKAIIDIIQGSQSHILDCSATLLLAQYNAIRLTIGKAIIGHQISIQKSPSL